MNLRVLLVEDSVSDEDLTIRALKRSGGADVHVAVARSLAQAKAMLRDETFDVVLGDVNLPDSQGLHTIRMLARPGGPPVVAHTGELDARVGLAVIEAGADDYVMKGSVDGARLQQLLQFAVQRRELAAGKLKAIEQTESLRAVEEANQFKAAFLNMAAHELGNPLTPIRLQLASLKFMCDRLGDDRLRNTVEVLDRNVARITGIVQDLMQVGRIESRSLRFEWKTEDIGTLASQAAKAIRILVDETQMTMTVDAPLGVTALVDRDRVAQVVLNLLSNAVKYTPLPGTVRLHVFREGPDAVIEVEDSGRGIAPEDLKKLFQPFVRVGDMSSVKGTGMGLYICKGLVEAHGGTLVATSPGLGKGSTFTVRLPVAGPPMQASGAPPAAPGAANDLATM